MSKVLFIGLMSGTSVDGVDAALVEFSSSQQLAVLATQFTPYSDTLKQQINTLAHSDCTLNKHDITQLDKQLATIYAQCSLNLIAQHGTKKQAVLAIANHGQTIRHAPDANPPYSMQLGQSKLIAEQTGIATIGQFRQADLACGGQGAPLMPAFHKAIFNTNNSAVINIGGIANISILNDPVTGYDTGPGNTLLDQWIQKHQAKTYDANGTWAAQGKIIQPVLELLLTDSYFQNSAPKSTGPDYFNLAWLESKVSKLANYSPVDIQATLLALTIESIAQGIEDANNSIQKVYLCGGGVHNQTLVSALKKRLPAHSIDTTDTFNIPADWVEAVGFAWLGYCCYHHIESNIPSVTGANKAAVLGEIVQA